MISRDWILALSAGLSMGLLAGCSASRPNCELEIPQRGGQIRPPDQPAEVSPYHAQPAAPAEPAPLVSRVSADAAAPLQPPPIPPPGGGSEEAFTPKPPDTPAPKAARGVPAPETPAPRPEPLLEALRAYREKRPAEALDFLKPYDPTTRELLTLLLPLAVRFSEITFDRIPPRELAAVLDQLDAFAQVLRPRAARPALAVDKMCFCRNIAGFGDYDPLPEGHAFHAAAEGRAGEFVQFYVELRNFTSRKNGPFHETALARTLTIYDYERGQGRDARTPAEPHVVWKQRHLAKVEHSRSPRQDCFLNCFFNVPPRLPIGDYTLEVDIEDITDLPAGVPIPASRVARLKVPFRVCAPRPAAGLLSSAGPGPR